MKTYIINIKKVVNTLFAAVAVAAVVTVVFSSSFVKYASDRIIGKLSEKNTILSAFPLIGGVVSNTGNSDNSILKLILNEELSHPDKVVVSNFPVFLSIKDKLSEMYTDVYESNSYYKPEKDNKNKTDFPEILIPDNVYKAIETTSKSVNEKGSELDKKGIIIKNHTSYTPDMKSIYKDALKLEFDEKNTEILILHTHGSESYNPVDRSQDTDSNIVRVGSEMARVFEENGIKVIHSKVMHDIPRFNSSYSKSLETITKEIKNNPKISIILDVHRDAMIAENGDSYKTVCDYNGKKVAQVMFVVGTDGNGLSHPKWRENLKLAVRFQEQLNKICPNLARPIDLRNERFNQQTTSGTLIIEVGTNGNTLEEAVSGGILAATAISDVIKGM